MQTFILRQNIYKYRQLLDQEQDERARRMLIELLAASLRELTLIEARGTGLQADINQVHASARRTIFRDQFETSPQAYLLLDPRKGLHIVDINPAYAAATMTYCENVVGNLLFDVFPDNPYDPLADGVSNLYASLKRVVDSGTADLLPIQRYDIRNSDGIFVPRFWRTENSPILDTDGRLTYLLHHIADVTDICGNAKPPVESPHSAE